MLFSYCEVLNPEIPAAISSWYVDSETFFACPKSSLKNCHIFNKLEFGIRLKYIINRIKKYKCITKPNRLKNLSFMINKYGTRLIFIFIYYKYTHHR